MKFFLFLSFCLSVSSCVQFLPNAREFWIGLKFGNWKSRQFSYLLKFCAVTYSLTYTSFESMHSFLIDTSRWRIHTKDPTLVRLKCDNSRAIFASVTILLKTGNIELLKLWACSATYSILVTSRNYCLPCTCLLNISYIFSTYFPSCTVVSSYFVIPITSSRSWYGSALKMAPQDTTVMTKES